MNWDWQVFCKDIITSETVQGCYGRGESYTYLNWMFKAWGWTAAVSAGALVLALALGAVIGILRTLPQDRAAGRFWNAFAMAWVELFRNIPLLVQIFIWYFVFPALMPALKALPSFVLVVCALGLFTSARIAEQVRAGIQALPKGQRYAGMAVGFTTAQTYRYVILPMAVRIIFPPLTSESMNLLKNSSVAFAVSIPELTFYFTQVGEETSQPIVVYIAVCILYAASAFAVNRVMAFIEKKIQIPGFVVAGGTGGGH